MSSKNYSITILCFPYKYLPFPIDFIPKYFYKLPDLCGEDYVTLFLLTDISKNNPSKIYFTLDKAKEAYNKASLTDFKDTDILRAEIKLPDEFNIYSDDFDALVIGYDKLYFDDEQELIDHQKRVKKAILKFTNDVFYIFNKFLDKALDSLPKKENSNQDDIEKENLNTAEKLKALRRKI